MKDDYLKEGWTAEGPPYFCPRCDRSYDTKQKLIDHVYKQHPDHDPNWAGQFDT